MTTGVSAVSGGPVLKEKLAVLTLGAVGVVYGDIGTSPLYAFRECFNPIYGLQLTQANVFGVLSLLFWTLILVVSIKYTVLIMRADNNGEGGTLALLALVLRHYRASRWRWLLTGLGITGTSMFYGDSMLTPAISVLSAVEGLEVITPVFEPYVVPLALMIITGLFLAQKSGTSRLGRLFGPITSLWFLTLAILGLIQIAKFPPILASVNPADAIGFFMHHSWTGFLILGAVFLCVTGVEALYADMGHFGKKPIRVAWFGLVMPALVLNYFGQGALVLTRPDAIRNPFYLLAPSWATPLLVIFATFATVIASQAVISGAFSLTAQAIKLGYSPRMEIQYPSTKHMGQIYLPFVNWSLFGFVVLLVLEFDSSSKLASAYGLAVSVNMVVTSLLTLALLLRVSRWPRLMLAAMSALLLIDLSFLSANALKIPQGGWVPLVIGAACYLLLSTWKNGRRIFSRSLAQDGMSMDLFLQNLASDPSSPMRIDGTAVFMSGSPSMVPHALLHNLKHNKVLHNRVIVLTLTTCKVPYVEPDKRLTIVELGCGFYRIEALYGFQEKIRVEDVLKLFARQHNLVFDMMDTTFFLARATVIPNMHVPCMGSVREKLFAWMFKNASPITHYFDIPSNRVVELGAHVEI